MDIRPTVGLTLTVILFCLLAGLVVLLTATPMPGPPRPVPHSDHVLVVSTPATSPPGS